MTQINRQERFMRLLVANQPRIYATIRAIGLNRHDAEDVLQDTVAVLWRRFDEFQEGTHFDRWACTVARFQTLNFRQKTSSRAVCLLDYQTIEALAIDANRIHDSLVSIHESLDDCLDRLAKKDRELINERFLAERTNAEIGRLMEKSESTVSRALSRVYNKLLKCIQSHSQPSMEGIAR